MLLSIIYIMMIMVIDDLQNEDNSQLQNNDEHDHPQHDNDHYHVQHDDDRDHLQNDYDHDHQQNYVDCRWVEECIPYHLLDLLPGSSDVRVDG